MIRISIDGALMPVPDNYSVGREVVGEFARNAAGNMIGDLVAVKDVITAGWRMIGGEDYGRLVRGAQPIFVMVEYFDSAAGALKTSVMHVRPRGGRIVQVAGGFWWKDVSCEFVER